VVGVAVGVVVGVVVGVAVDVAVGVATGVAVGVAVGVVVGVVVGVAIGDAVGVAVGVVCSRPRCAAASCGSGNAENGAAIVRWTKRLLGKTRLLGLKKPGELGVPGFQTENTELG
jgi:hypothetical protein